MIKNPLVFIIDENGDYLRYSGIIKALNGYSEEVVVITPQPINVFASVSMMPEDANNQRYEQYARPTSKKGSDYLATTDALYQTVFNWSVFTIEIKKLALSTFSKFRSGNISFAFAFQSINPSSKAVTNMGVFGVDNPLPTDYDEDDEGKYFTCEDYDFSIVSGTFTYSFSKGMIAYWNGERWVKDRLKTLLSTSAANISVEPNHAVGYELEDDEINIGESVIADVVQSQLDIIELQNDKMDKDISNQDVPIEYTPTLDEHLVVKKYVDDADEVIQDQIDLINIHEDEIDAELVRLENEKADVTYVDAQDTAKLAEAKAYTDSEVATAKGEAIADANQYTDNEITAHDTSSVAHAFIRGLIDDLEREVARLDGRGKSYGEVPYTTAQLQAMDASNRALNIKEAIEAQDWFEGTYTPSNADLVYDTGVGAGVNYHEWEYNGTAWVDNGAINSPKASETIFGTVKGDGTYLTIVAGLVQVLKSDYTDALGTSVANLTYQQVADALADRYTKAEADAIWESIKLIQGVTETSLGSFNNPTTFPYADIEDYDFVLASWSANAATPIENYTVYFKPSSLTQGNCVRTQIQNNPVRLGCLNHNTLGTINVGVVDANNNVQAAFDATVKLVGFSLIDTEAVNVITEYDDTNYLDGKVTQDAVNRELDTQVKVNADAIDVIEADIVDVKAKDLEQDRKINEAIETARKVASGDTQSTVSDTKIITMPKNVAQGQVIPTLNGMTLQSEQLITNGDFSDGTTGWTPTNATWNVTNGVANVTATAQNGNIAQNISTVTGQKYYVTLKYKTPNVNVRINDFGLGGLLLQTNGTNEWTIYSAIRIGTTTTNFGFFSLIERRTSGFTEFSQDDVFIFNISTLIANKQYSPLFNTTFDLMTDANIKTQMDLWVADGTLPNDNIQSVMGNKKLLATGKNLFDTNLSLWVKKVGGTLTLDSGTYYYTRTSGGNFDNFVRAISVKRNTSYIFSFNFIGGNNGEMRFGTTDGGAEIGTVTLPTGAKTRTVTTGDYDFIYVTVRGTASGGTLIFNDFQLELGSTATAYAPYVNSKMFIQPNAKLNRLPNGVKDTIEFKNGKFVHVKRVQEVSISTLTGWVRVGSLDKTNTIVFRKTIFSDHLRPTNDNGLNGMILYTNVITFNEKTYTGLATIDSEGIAVRTTENFLNVSILRSRLVTEDVAGFETWLQSLTHDILLYQLATPIETEIQTQGQLLGYANGTVQISNAMQDYFVYDTAVNLVGSDYPIKTLDKLSILNSNGVETILNPSTAVIAMDGLSFTHSGITAGDVVFYEWTYQDTDNVFGLTDIKYYNSDIVRLSPNGTAYKLQWSVDNDGVVTFTSVAV